MGYINELYESDELNAAGDMGEFAIAYADDFNWLVAEKVEDGSFFSPDTTNFLAGYGFGLYHAVFACAPDLARSDVLELLATEAITRLTPSLRWEFHTNEELCDLGYIPDELCVGFIGEKDGYTVCLFQCDGELSASVYDSDGYHMLTEWAADNPIAPMMRRIEEAFANLD